MDQPLRFTEKSKATAWLEKHFTAWAEQLDDDERTAVATYKEDDYERINESLRRGAGDEPEIEALDSALAIAKLPAAVIVYRSERRAVELPAGTVLTDRGYWSTSLLSEIAWSFSSNFADTETTRFEILVPGGAHAAAFVGAPDLVVFQGEAEILLPRDSTFRVVRQGTITELEVILNE